MGIDRLMGIFAALRENRAFRRRHMQFLQTPEDCDLILEIGFHQERGTPLTMKHLQLLGLASVPTLQRRLRHLRQAGAVVVKRSEADGRAVELMLSPKLLKTYARYIELIRSLQVAEPGPVGAAEGAGAE
jgi:DNA-binding MarR family transcriptional regulator